VQEDVYETACLSIPRFTPHQNSDYLQNDGEDTDVCLAVVLFPKDNRLG
jgi:hypothetical protein